MLQDLPQDLIDTATDVLEARRNPDQNPKLSAYELLKPYSNRGDIYISFTVINKIGLNPKSGYNTPIGVYTYPLKITWKEYDIDSEAKRIPSTYKSNHLKQRAIDKIIQNAYPYVSESPYIQVLQRKPNRGFVDLGKYSQSDYQRDIEKLREMINEDAIYYGSPFSERVFEDFVAQFERESNFKSPGGLFWNVTRMFSKYFDDEPRVFKDPLPRKPLVAWNELLQRFGYDAFLDSEGKGIIHPNEPWQAVFLTKRSFKHIDTVMNNREELTLGKIPRWLAEAETKDAEFTVSAGIVFWHGGTWIDGTWKNGVFEDGIWKVGTWENGIFRGGIWEDGRWEDGTWEGGTWIKGVIRSKKFVLFGDEYTGIPSAVPPNEFYKIEKRTKTSTELLNKVKPRDARVADDFEQI